MTINWFKSSFSHDNGCVELADLGPSVGVRDSKLGDASPVLHLTSGQLAGLLEGVQVGRLDDLSTPGEI